MGRILALTASEVMEPNLPDGWFVGEESRPPSWFNFRSESNPISVAVRALPGRPSYLLIDEEKFHVSLNKHVTRNHCLFDLRYRSCNCSSTLAKKHNAFVQAAVQLGVSGGGLNPQDLLLKTPADDHVKLTFDKGRTSVSISSGQASLQVTLWATIASNQMMRLDEDFQVEVAEVVVKQLDSDVAVYACAKCLSKSCFHMRVLATLAAYDAGVYEALLRDCFKITLP